MTTRKFHPFTISFLIISSLILIYCVASWVVSGGDLSQTHLAYYNYLLSSLYHGRLNVTPFLSSTDLAWHDGKWFFYWGPAPTLFIAPFYLIAKTKASDVIYTLAAGSLNIVLFYLVSKQVNVVFKLRKKTWSLIFILVNFALISPHFYLSLQGRVWHTNQVIATSFLLAFLLFYFKFWGNSKKIVFFVLSIIFLNLAVLSRYTLVFYFILFLPLLWKTYQRAGKKLISRMLIIVSSITLSFFILMSIYNYARFGNILETGISFINIRTSEKKIIEQSDERSLAGLKYFKHNFETYFLNHLDFLPEKPFLKIDKEGNSVISVYPLLILTPMLFLKRFFFGKKYSLFLATALFGVILPITFYLLFYLSTGWAQFGMRYYLDIIPLLFILFLLVVEKIPIPVRIIVIAYGVFVNIAGAILFYAS